MPFPSAQTVAEKWAQRAGAAGQAYVDGVMSTTIDPTQRAAAAAQKALTGYQSAITSGRWQRRLAEVGQAGWRAGVQAKGAANYGVGIAAAKAKYQAGYADFANAMSGTLSQIESMPKVTLQDSLARSAAWITAAAAYRQNR